MKYLLISILFIVLMVVAALLNNLTLTVFSMAGSLIFLVVWLVSKPKTVASLKFLSPFLCITAGVLLLVLFRFQLLFYDLITNSDKLLNDFYQAFVVMPDGGETAIMFLLFVLPFWTLGVILMIAGVLLIYRRYFKK